MIRVRKSEQTYPFSEGIMAKSLTGAGLPVSDAYRVVRQIRTELHGGGAREITSDELRQIVSRKLKEGGWETEEHFYRLRRHIKYLADPVFVLIGGTTGVGKSTVAAELGHRLGINRVIGTDTIREIMRSIISRNLIPTLHESTFEADRALHLPHEEEELLTAFREQVRVVSEGLAAVVRRGTKEGLHMVLNGVHVVPGYLETQIEQKPRHLFQYVLSVPDRKQHEMFFYEREQASRRMAQRYVRRMDAIREVQDFILARAEQHGVRVVENVEFAQTLNAIEKDIISGFAQEFEA